MIPKKIHQIWFQGWKNLPLKYFKNVESVINHNSKWDHYTWDEKTLRIECNKFGPEALKKFDSFDKMMRKICFGRYVVLYNNGGISIDTDAESIQSLDNIPGIEEDELIISKSPFFFEDFLSLRGMQKGIIMMNCATIACKKHDILMKNFINFLIENESWDSDPQFEEQIQTGPLITSIFFNRHIDEIRLLEPEILEPLGNITDQTVLNHKYELSWVHPVFQFLKEPYFLIRNTISKIIRHI